MAMVIRVRFKRAAKLYDFDPNGLDLHNGMSVVTETARGVELGECMSGIMDMPDERLVLPLKPIIRIATLRSRSRSVPNTSTVPALLLTSELTMPIRVDLPAPLGPSKA